MKNIVFYVGLIGFILSLSCCTKPVQQVTELIQINIDPDKVEKIIDISPMLSDSIDIIPLETTDECLLSNIKQLTFHKGHFYILDGTRRNIFVFDEAGRFVRKIGKQGNGPGEYSAIMYYSIVGDSILIQNQHGFNGIIYSSTTGEVVKNYTHSVSHLNGFCLGKNVYFLTNYEKVNQENFNLCKFDLSTGEVVDKSIPFDDKLVKYSSIGLMNSVSKYKDSVYVIYPYNDTIYQVTKEGVSPLYNLHFTSRNLPDDISVNDNFWTVVAKEGYVKGLEYMQVSKDYVFGMYIDKGNSRYICIDRNTFEAKVTDCFTVKKLGHLPLSQFFVFDEDLISVVPASSLEVSLNSILSSPYAPTEERYKERLKELQKNLKEDSNPVLFRYRFKETR